MRLSPTQLRQNLYQTLDHVLKTGEIVEITRHGKTLKLIGEMPHDRFSALKPMKNLLNCKPEDLENIDWSKEWKP